MPNIMGYQEIRTVEGDAFDKLALEFYNDEKQASVIMAANLDYLTVLIFEAGVTVRIPILDNVQTPETLPPWRRGA